MVCDRTECIRGTRQLLSLEMLCQVSWRERRARAGVLRREAKGGFPTSWEEIRTCRAPVRSGIHALFDGSMSRRWWAPGWSGREGSVWFVGLESKYKAPWEWQRYLAQKQRSKTSRPEMYIQKQRRGVFKSKLPQCQWWAERMQYCYLRLWDLCTTQDGKRVLSHELLV